MSKLKNKIFSKKLVILNIILGILLPISFIFFIFTIFLAGFVLNDDIDPCYAGGIDFLSKSRYYR